VKQPFGRWHQAIIALAVFFVTHHVHADLPESVSAALKNNGLNESQVSIFVQPLADQPAHLSAPLIAHQSDTPLNPASSMKLLTSYAALKLLGPQYRWKTEVYADGKIINGVLYGDLIFKGYGDPNFTQADLWQLLHTLRQQGIKEIKGNILLDQGYFASAFTDAGKFDSEPLRAYNATANAFIINNKTTSFRFDSEADHITVQQQPDLAELKVLNNLKLSQGQCANWRNDLRYDVSRELEITSVIFSGSFPANCKDKYLELLALSENDYHLFLFRKLWIEAGGLFSGKLFISPLPAQAFKLAQHESKSLSQLLPEINKWSNNLMAKQMLLTIGAEKNGLPATELNAAQAVKNWLVSEGLHFDEMVLENGSGLSRIERISAAHLGRLLTHAFYSPTMPELMTSLPILGVDGTMQRRLKMSPAAGQGHLKTGSVKDVYSIAGYMLGKSGERYAIVFMVNDAQASSTRAAQDALLEWVYLH
jgi:D-alanyl-D-alanine carboxypeptidase/D-alanyl-D-alanine-endopeptidase (penicillin-binding protein 4)